jgi:large subunit ribosomal protein L28
MAAVCQVTGAVPGFGHNISFSHRRTKRRFDPNVQRKTYYVPSLRRTVTLNVSARGIKVIDRRGIDTVVREILARGEKI